jgi:hypothetical protein
MTWDFGPPPADYRVLEPDPAPVYQQAIPSEPPMVVVPGVTTFRAQPGKLPGTYFVPGPGGPRWFSVVPFGR